MISTGNLSGCGQSSLGKSTTLWFHPAHLLHTCSAPREGSWDAVPLKCRIMLLFLVATRDDPVVTIARFVTIDNVCTACFVACRASVLVSAVLSTFFFAFFIASIGKDSSCQMFIKLTFCKT